MRGYNRLCLGCKEIDVEDDLFSDKNLKSVLIAFLMIIIFLSLLI